MFSPVISRDLPSDINHNNNNNNNGHLTGPLSGQPGALAMPIKHTGECTLTHTQTHRHTHI